MFSLLYFDYVPLRIYHHVYEGSKSELLSNSYVTFVPYYLNDIAKLFVLKRYIFIALYALYFTFRYYILYHNTFTYHLYFSFQQPIYQRLPEVIIVKKA